jgi:hypothetical protein
MIKYLRFLLYVLIIQSFPSLGLANHGQENPPIHREFEKVEFGENYINDFQKDPAFQYEEATQEKTWFDNLRDKANIYFKKIINWIFGEGEINPFWSFIFQFLPYFLLIIILVLLVYMVLKYDNTARKSKEDVLINSFSLNEDALILQNQDIKSLVDKAISSSDYSLAVRYYYLLILQKMISAGHISWQPYKTNQDYLNEIPNGKNKAVFASVIKFYNHIWYGKFGVNEERYRQVEVSFKQLEQSL